MEVAEGPALVALPSPLPAWGPALCDVVAWSGDLSPPRARAADPARARAPATRGSALKGAAARSAAARGEGPSTSEPAGAERSYCLVVVGEDGRSPRLCPEGGHIVEDFTHLLASGGFLPAPGPAAPAPAPAAPAPAAPKREKPPAGKPTARSALPTYRKGGPCDHCRCTGKRARATRPLRGAASTGPRHLPAPALDRGESPRGTDGGGLGRTSRRQRARSGGAGRATSPPCATRAAPATGGRMCSGPRSAARR